MASGWVPGVMPDASSGVAPCTILFARKEVRALLARVGSLRRLLGCGGQAAPAPVPVLAAKSKLRAERGPGTNGPTCKPGPAIEWRPHGRAGDHMTQLRVNVFKNGRSAFLSLLREHNVKYLEEPPQPGMVRAASEVIYTSSQQCMSRAALRRSWSSGCEVERLEKWKSDAEGRHEVCVHRGLLRRVSLHLATGSRVAPPGLTGEHRARRRRNARALAWRGVPAWHRPCWRIALGRRRRYRPARPRGGSYAVDGAAAARWMCVPAAWAA